MYGDRQYHTRKDKFPSNQYDRNDGNRRNKSWQDDHRDTRDQRDSHKSRDRGKWHTRSNNKWTKAQWDEYKYRKANNLCLVCARSDCRANRHPRHERGQSNAYVIDQCTDTESEDDDTTSMSNDGNNEAFVAMPTQFHNVDYAYVSRTLATQSTIHALTGKTFLSSKEDSPDMSLSVETNTTDNQLSPAAYINTRYDNHTFYGLMADTGNGGRTVGGLRQLQAFQRIYPEVQRQEEVQYEMQFGIGLGKAMGVCHIHTPIGNLDVYIVDADLPFLIGLK